jgi:hypothetical protein
MMGIHACECEALSILLALLHPQFGFENPIVSVIIQYLYAMPVGEALKSFLSLDRFFSGRCLL